MHLYALTLQKSSGITAALYGTFSGARAQEVIVARCKVLELMRPDDNGKMQTVFATDVFGIIRSLATCRLTGGNRDYIVIGSDSGKIVIVEFSAEKGCFERVHAETYGKTGLRRIVPGQYIATDPRGRAVMVGAVEKQKLVYTLNRDSAARLTISSPLEAHKSNVLTFHIIGVDVGFENPIFAALEVDMEEVENDPETGEVLYEKNLVYYELDLGLNHVVRKWSDAVDPTSNLLVSIPGGGGADGPSGVLVCSENFVVYKNQGHPDRRCAIPRRRDLPADQGLLLVSSAVHKQRDLFFVLLQSEHGDLYKVTLDWKEEQVSELKVRYLDSVPVCASLCILKTGFLFCASESGNHGFYQFQGVGEDEDSPSCSSLTFESGDETIVEIEPRPLQNLLHVDDIDSLCPLIDCKVADVNKDGTPTLLTLCGKGPRSTLRLLRHGLAVSEMAVSELPGNPNAVWTVKTRRDAEHDAYIVVSFANVTLILSVGETVEEVTDSGLNDQTPTLFVGLVGEDSLVQVYKMGWRQLRSDQRNEWKAPHGKEIECATANNRQLAIAVEGGEVIYFELDLQGVLAEVDKKVPSGTKISCIEVGAVPAGRQRSRFLAVGSWDNTIRILSLDPDDCMTVLAVLAVPTLPKSAALVSMPLGRSSGAEALVLCIGLDNGVMLRARLDPRNGQLSDTRTRFLGAKPVKLVSMPFGGTGGVLALSSRPFATYCYQHSLHLTPLSYQGLDYGCAFSSEHCAEGFVGIAGNTLRILAVEKLSDTFNAESIPLRYTPRRLAIHSVSGHAVVVEADHNAYNEEEKQQLYTSLSITPPLPAGSAAPDEEEEEGPPLMEANVGVPRAQPGKWASCIRVVDPASKQTLSILELADNEAALSIAMIPLRDREGEIFVFVGTVKDMTLHPRQLSAAFIHVYQFTNKNTTLALVHKTQVEDVPYAMANFCGRLMAGVGNRLRIYDMGKKKLLRKCELKGLPTMIQSINVVSPSRIVVGDLAESFHFIKYNRQDNVMMVFADDVSPRWLTAAAVLDVNTLAGADKFGNIFVSRLPQEVSDDVDDAQLLSSAVNEAMALNGAPCKSEELVQYHVGELVTSLQKVTLGAGHDEILLYTTILGGVGALLPFSSKDDLDLCQALEMHLRQDAPPLSGKDQLVFRSSYFPLKGIVDGDFCSVYNRLSPEEQRSIAEELDRTPAEVSKKLEELASRII